MFGWIRKLPHFGYGKCGGASRDCSIIPPHDWMDIAFKEHDDELEKAKTQEEYDKADKRLGEILKKGDPKKLRLWGRIYRRFAMIFFN